MNKPIVEFKKKHVWGNKSNRKYRNARESDSDETMQYIQQNLINESVITSRNITRNNHNRQNETLYGNFTKVFITGWKANNYNGIRQKFYNRGKNVMERY